MRRHEDGKTRRGKTTSQAEARLGEEHYPDDLCVLSFDGEMQWRLEINVLQIEVGSSLLYEKLGDLHVIIQCCQMQCGISVVLFLVDNPRARKFGQQDAHRTATRRGRETGFRDCMERVEET